MPQPIGKDPSSELSIIHLQNIQISGTRFPMPEFTCNYKVWEEGKQGFWHIW